MGLEVTNYTLKITESDKLIVDDVNFSLPPGEIVALVGDNGVGKSSFATSLLGLETFEREGSVKIGGKETIDLSIEEIAKLGLFVSFQSPPEFEGVSVFEFISAAYRNLHGTEKLSSFKLRKKIIEISSYLGFDETMLNRSLNQGFSGGEKRKSEILQMLVLEPKIVILDEVDSGLDLKSKNKVIETLNTFKNKNSKDTSFLIISHNIDFLQKVSLDRIIELKNHKLSLLKSIENLSLK